MKSKKQKLAALKKLSKEELMVLYYAKQAEHSRMEIWHTYERNIFAACKQQRTHSGKVKNRFSREEAGTFGTYIRTMRFENSYITKVCKSRNMY